MSRNMNPCVPVNHSIVPGRKCDCNETTNPVLQSGRNFEMTNQTNNPSWQSGYSGNQAPYGASPNDSFNHEQGRLQRLREQQDAADRTAKAQRDRASKQS
jgi:hypothetical protein